MTHTLSFVRALGFSLYCLVILAITSCSTPHSSLPVAPDVKQIVDISDLFQTGHSRFQSIMDKDTSLNEIWNTRRAAVVLVFIDIEWDDGEKEQAQQSGIILDEGKLILTAGHGFVIEDGIVTEIRVRTSSNLEAIVNVASLAYDKQKSPVVDWALLRPVHAIPHDKPEPLTPPEEKDVVLVLGYPGGLGVNSDERVVRVQESIRGNKYPLGMVCDQQRFDKNTLFPIAGTVPIRGISGAPVFNTNGELIGIFSSMGRRRNLVGWQYIFWMSEIPFEAIKSLKMESRR